jgi:non-specific serine/threonine protein kinase
LLPADQECHDHYTTTTRARLGEAAFAAAWAEGRAMTLDQAVEYGIVAAQALATTRGKSRAAATDAGPLTLRERAVAVLVADGLSNRDIATRLVVSERTVETHVQHIVNKLSIHSRIHVATWVVQQRLAPATDE